MKTSWEKFRVYRAQKERDLALLDLEMANHKAVIAQESARLELLLAENCAVCDDNVGEASSPNQELPSAAEKVHDKGDNELIPHSDDYRCVLYNGKWHTLTTNQAIIVRILDQEYRHGRPQVASAKLLEAIGPRTSRVRDSFKKSPLWRTLIVKGSRKDLFRLNLPDPRP